MNYLKDNLNGLRVTIMGLGLHGGGLSSALFFLKRGAKVVITDLKQAALLEPSLAQLASYPVQIVCGEHREEDFTNTDLVIKNPAVPSHSRYLQLAAEHGVAIETDISVFLQSTSNPIIAVTGSKGKSTTASAIYHVLKQVYPDTQLGGNITNSPLNFIDKLAPQTPVVFELSSWQLADLKGKNYFKPRIGVFTVILPDHLNHYPSMTEYIEDKKILYSVQDKKDICILNFDDPYQRAFTVEANVYFVSAQTMPPGLKGAYLAGNKGHLFLPPYKDSPVILPDGLLVPGEHNRVNLLSAALALSLYGVETETIKKHLKQFPGVEHRLELFHTAGGINFYNDSAATIPQATIAALKALRQPIILITGGTDKKLDFQPFAQFARIPKQIVLLAGSATEKLRKVLDNAAVPYLGPFPDLKTTVTRALAKTAPGDALIFSPGCASFELFKNEFHRGECFKTLIREIAKQ